MRLFKLLDEEEVRKAKAQIHALKDHYTLLPDNSGLDLLGACSYIHKDIYRPKDEPYNPKAKLMDELAKGEWTELEMDKEKKTEGMVYEDSYDIVPLHMVIYEEEEKEGEIFLPENSNYTPETQEDDNLESYYHKIKRVTNPILDKNFRWIYDKIINFIEKEYGEKAVINDEANLGYPGFHIYYPIEGCESIIDSPPHVDLQWSFHLNDLKSLFKNVSEETFMTFTLAIEIPSTGAGLYYWDCPEEIVNDYFACRDFYRHVIIKAKKFLEKSTDRLGYEELLQPQFLDYKEGEMTLFKGFPLHQTGLFNKGWTSNDRRITMQGHGIKCDGIWRIFF